MIKGILKIIVPILAVVLVVALIVTAPFFQEVALAIKIIGSLLLVGVFAGCVGWFVRESIKDGIEDIKTWRAHR